MRAVVPPWRFSKTPSSIDTWTPDLGEHNMDVFHGIIGLPKSEVESLQESQVIWLPRFFSLPGNAAPTRLISLRYSQGN